MTGSINRQTVSVYIAELCTGLVGMAEGARLDLLAYLLDMARIEAEAAAKGADEPRSTAPVATKDQRDSKPSGPTRV